MRRHDDSTGRRLYRSRNGVICGVCRGLAEYSAIGVGWVRFFTIMLFFFTGMWPILVLYFLGCLLMKPEPVIPLENEYQRDFYDNYVSSRSRTLRDLKRRFSNLDRRMCRMEDRVTSKDFEWERRLNT